MPVQLVTAAIAAFLWFGAAPASVAQPSLSAQGIAALRACRLQVEDTPRLTCYDRAVDRYLSFDFAGAGRGRTPVFESLDGFRLGYRNEDVIFVIYVFDADDETLIKSHSSGPGEGEIAIRRRGRFYAEVKATGDWKLWIRSLDEAGIPDKTP